MSETPRLRLPLGVRPRVVLAGYSAARFRERERHRRDGEWMLHLFGYAGEVEWGGERHAFRPGWMGLTGPGETHVLHRPKSAPHHYVIFSTSVGDEGPFVSLPRVWEPIASSSTGDVFRLIRRCFRVNPLRSEVALWELLWTLARPFESGRREAPRKEPAILREAVALLERDLRRPLPVAEVQALLGVSHTRLAALFKAHCGKGPKAFIVERRCAWARRLLETTHLSIKEVAFETGFPDLHAFNKTMRRIFGASPKKLRLGEDIEQGPAPVVHAERGRQIKR